MAGKDDAIEQGGGDRGADLTSSFPPLFLAILRVEVYAARLAKSLGGTFPSAR